MRRSASRTTLNLIARRAALAVTCVIGLAAMVPSARAADDPTACPAANVPTPELVHSRSAIMDNKELLIVTLGSSSTEGVMSSAAAHTYPSDLQAALTRLLPESHVAVINRGIGGQDAVEEVARLDSDVIAVHPHLVIWQVGANGALEHVDPNQFRQRVAAGVHRLQLAGADVILMDNQRSPKLMAQADPDLMNNALATVARDLDVGLFQRSKLMDAWQDGGAPYSRFISSDQMHQNDLGYYCVSNALARSIATSILAHRQVAGAGATGPAKAP